jgi:hypothetical protein
MNITGNAVALLQRRLILDLQRILLQLLIGLGQLFPALSLTEHGIHQQHHKE